MDTNKTFHLKDFIKLGYKKTQVHTVSRTSVFEDLLDAGQGYANTYGFNQAMLICIGCELLRIGLSSRHVDQVLYQVSLVDFVKHAEGILKQNSAIFVFRADVEQAHLEKYRKELKGGFSTAIGKNLVTGEYIEKRTPYEKMRSAPIRAEWAFTDQDAADFNTALSTHIRVNVGSILEALTR